MRPLSAEITRFGLLAQLAKHQRQSGVQSPLPDTPLLPGKPQIQAHNRRFNTISEVYHHLRQALDQDPTSAELHRRLGNMLRNGDRPDLALPYYQAALELDPDESEASYNLVEVLVEQEHYREAIPHVEALIQFCREGEMEEDQRRHLLGWLIEHTALIKHHTQHHFELFPALDKPETSTLDDAEEKNPTVYLTSFDLTEDDDFEDVYQVFRTGRLPETSRHSPQRKRRRERGHHSVSTLPAPAVHAAPVRTRQQKVGRNASCPCGSGRKYKKCCGR
jgi:tetratricopeptide (TPR) repeat protein